MYHQKTDKRYIFDKLLFLRVFETGIIHDGRLILITLLIYKLIENLLVHFFDQLFVCVDI